MSNENEKIDNIVGKTMRNLGDQIARMYDKKLLEQFKFSERYMMKCAKCQISLLSHKSELGHPFFEDNLQYLEWEDERRRHS